jgi:hypothetical protein
MYKGRVKFGFVLLTSSCLLLLLPITKLSNSSELNAELNAKRKITGKLRKTEFLRKSWPNRWKRNRSN